MTGSRSSASDMDPGDVRAYTVLTARLLGIHLDDDEIDPVAEQVARVAAMVEQMDRIDDDAVTPAPEFAAGSSLAIRS